MRTLFNELHNPAHLWADVYAVFENLMNLGLKELYFREAKSNESTKIQANSELNTPEKQQEPLMSASLGRKTFSHTNSSLSDN